MGLVAYQRSGYAEGENVASSACYTNTIYGRDATV